jgi:hypothetical protein
MARFRENISSFLGGEVSPKVWGRADLPTYKQACEIIENMIVFPQGGVGMRPGSQHQYGDLATETELTTALPQVRTIPFIISKTEAYIIVLTTDDTQGAKGIFVFNPASGTLSTPTIQFSADAEKQFIGYLTSDIIREVAYAQYGNAVFLSQSSTIPIAIEKKADGSFYLVPFWGFATLGYAAAVNPTDAQKAVAWPYMDVNTTAATYQCGATSGTFNMSRSGTPYLSLSSSSIGSMIRMTGDSAAVTGAAVINAVGGGGVLNVTSRVTFEDTNASTLFHYSAWSDQWGWPRSVCFFEGRIMYGGNTTFPNSVWGSRSANIADLRQQHWVQDSPSTVTNDDPFSFAIASAELNAIQWISPSKNLVIGTLGREYLAFGPDPALSMGPLNYNFSSESAIGSKAVQPVRVDNALIYIQRSGRRLREFIFNFQEDSFKSLDISKIAEHMPRRTLANLVQEDVDNFGPPEYISICLQNSDDPIIWLVDANGGLVGITRDRDAEVVAFHYHKMGGSFDDGSNVRQPWVLSACVVPSSDGTHDDLYLTVMRTVDSQTVTTLEKIGRAFELDAVYNDSTSLSNKMCYSDCAKLVLATVPGTPQLVYSGFDYLEGETVVVVADGKYMGELTVTSGDITLPYAAEEVVVGLSYTAVLKPMNINLGSVLGSSQATPKSMDTITVRFNRTIGAKFGSSMSDLEEIQFRDPMAAQDDAIALFTGDKEMTFKEGWEAKRHIYVVQDLPLPMQIDCIITRGLAND